MVSISNLEWHVAHACNFTCENCCHFSNHGHSVPVTYEQIEQWYDSWAHRIAPKTIDILGGEPLLNKRICDIVELTRKKWDKPSLERLDITTNGVLLNRYPDLPKILADNNCGLKILQSKSTKSKRKLSLVKDYDVKNVSEKIVRIIHSYIDYINRKIWKKFSKTYN